MTISKRALPALIAGSALIGSLALAGTAFAAGPGEFGHGRADMPRPAVIGTVASISGDTLTVSSKGWQRGSTTTTATTYTVDATNATVTKDGTASSVSAIVSGDQVMVQGAVTGTTVVATKINDGKLIRNGKMPERKPGMGIASGTPALQGNGQPVIGGKVTAISGTTLTVTNASNVTYTVDVTSATITKPGVTGATISNIVVGDSVVAQGAVNGTSVTAVSIMDQSKPSITGATGDDSSTQEAHQGGFMGAIGGFFSRMFGFF